MSQPNDEETQSLAHKQATQDIFNKVVTHLLTQNEMSVAYRASGDPNIKGMCAYRGKDGLKCAVGCLIEDDEYLPIMEGIRVMGLVGKLVFERGDKTRERRSRVPVHEIVINNQSYNVKALSDRLFPHLELLNRLQQIHDAGEVSRWEEQLREIAEKFGLQFVHPSRSV